MKAIGVLVAAILVSAVTWADAGQVTYQQRCASCHSSDASGNTALKAPNISGMAADYLTRQLNNYKLGKRGSQPGDTAGMMMKGIASALSVDEVSAVSEYLERMPRVEVYQAKTFAGFRARGLYSGCGSCHGAEGEGYPALGAPRISEQYDWYLKSQLQAFRTGSRGAHLEDERGQQMRVMAEAIGSEDDLDVLVKYIVGLGIK